MPLDTEKCLGDIPRKREKKDSPGKRLSGCHGEGKLHSLSGTASSHGATPLSATDGASSTPILYIDHDTIYKP